MSAVALVAVGLLLCFAGAWSLRVTVAAAGFGLTWQLAALFGAGLTITLLASLAGGAAALLLAVALKRTMLFVVGAVVGAVVAARLFALLGGTEASWVLALVFIPALAIVGGWLAQRWRHRFLRGATAVAGAALVLAGAGTLLRGQGGLFFRPEGAAESTWHVLVWAALAVAGVVVQRRGARDLD